MSTCRLAAILAADVVGLSKLIGNDKAGTLSALAQAFVSKPPLVPGYPGLKMPSARKLRQTHSACHVAEGRRASNATAAHTSRITA
jgi:hypothetical protein